jgi:glycine/D-amino acid oxidase-like deaminating enzyme/nitrite reductase/ring-hydroxylating ferredoxin subunit
MNKSGNTSSVWMEVKPTQTFETLNRSIECDVCVIGAGIAGLTTAYMLAKEGKKVVVVEKFPQIAQGETGRTTAQLVAFTDFSYAQLKRMHGDQVKLIAESHRYALETIGRIALDEAIDCDYRKVPVFLFAPREEDYEKLDKEVQTLRDMGMMLIRHPRLPMKGLPEYPCIEIPGMAQMHALKYMFGLGEALNRLGVKIYTNTQASTMDEKDSHVEIKTTEGHLIRCAHMVTATNSPVSVLTGVHLKQAAWRTYVVGLRVEKGALPYAIWWDTLEPYHYVRLVEFPDYDVLLAGGEDHHTGRDEKGGPDVDTVEEGESPERFESLENWARGIFPQCGELLYKWSGQVMESIDGIGYIGRQNAKDRSFIITGDTGSGTTNATLGARLITDLITGVNNPWEQLYSPARLNLRAADELIKEGAAAFWQFKSYLTSGDVEESSEIANGSGAIVREGVKKVAMYKNEQGEVHMMSAICPHLGCIVQWNDIEKSWDCPCHGSRFDCYGKVLNGPAVGNLETIEAEIAD